MPVDGAGFAVPACRGNGLFQPCPIDGLRGQREQGFGFFQLGVRLAASSKVFGAIQAQPLSQCCCRNPGLFGERPAKQGGGVAQGAYGMASIQLAVAESTFAIFGGVSENGS